MLHKLIMSSVLLLILIVPIQAQLINAPTTEVTAPQEEVLVDRFKVTMNKAIRSAVQKGDITRVKGFRLRVAMLSPAFRKHAEDLAVIQMAFSDDADVLPFDSEGRIERANIDWDAFFAFLEKLIPLLLELLNLSGA